MTVCTPSKKLAVCFTNLREFRSNSLHRGAHPVASIIRRQIASGSPLFRRTTECGSDPHQEWLSIPSTV